MKKTCLIIGHPGHELRIYGWLEREKPIVSVITDGSGNAGESRLSSTTTVLKNSGCEIGTVYGEFSDKEIYSVIINKDYSKLLSVVDRLANQLETEEIESVVGDAVEGYNPTHDVCRLLINSAVEVANKSRKVPLKNYDILLIGLPNSCDPELSSRAIWIDLDEQAFERKLKAAHSYPELLFEVETAIEKFGKEAFKMECLRPVETPLQFGILDKVPPFYETYGEKKVAEGVYKEVLRYKDHMLPLVSVLRNWVEERLE